LNNTIKRDMFKYNNFSHVNSPLWGLKNACSARSR
jgi:hypothetical protein